MKKKASFWKICTILSCLSISSAAYFSLVTSCQNDKKITFNVQFDTQGGSFIDTIKVKKDSTFSPPETLPTKSGYVFDGWYRESICQNKFNFTIPITHDVVVYAKWKSVGTTYSINFTTDGYGTVSKKSIVVLQGTKWSEVVHDNLLPEVTPFDEYTFEGWYKDNQKLLSSTQLAVMSNWNVVAHLTPPPDKYNISFLTDSGGSLDKNSILVKKDQGTTWKDVVNSGDLPTPTPLPGFTFDGWYKEDGDKEIKLNDTDTTLIDGSWIVLAKFLFVPPEGCQITLLNPPEDGFSIDLDVAPFYTDLNINISSTQNISQDDLWVLLVNGKKLLDYSFSISPSNHTKASLFIPGNQVTGDITIGFINSAAPQTNSFTTDDWSTVIYYANRGLASLMQAYHFETTNDLIGLEREVTVNGYAHKVRVIGCNHDFTDVEKKHPVALTFQFENVLAGKTCSASKLVWNNLDNENYWESNIYKCLDSLNNDCRWLDPNSETRSIRSMINETDLVLARNIKTVYRGANVVVSSDKSSNKHGLVTNATKIFALTLGDIFSPEGIQKSIESSTQCELYINESWGQYDYYKNTIGNIGFSSPQGIEALVKKDVLGNSVSYWLASPYITNAWKAWYVESNGNVVSELGVTWDHNSIVPCFCI